MTKNKDWTSIWSSIVRDRNGNIKKDRTYNMNLRPDAGDDWQAECMAGDNTFAAAGTASAATATSLTTTGLTASAHIGKILAVGANSAGAGSVVYGVITANSTTVFTVDQWYNAATPSGSAGTTPNATAQFQVLPGQHPAVYLAVSDTVQSGAAGDTTLPGELTTDGFVRVFYTTYAHTAGAVNYSLSKTFTATGTRTINSGALFNARSAGQLAFIFAETSPPTLVSGDTLAQTVLVNY